MTFPHPEEVRSAVSKGEGQRKRSVESFVYILKCSDGSYYVGSSRKPLVERVAEHNNGIFGGYTAKRRPVTLVFSQSFDRVEDTIAAERQIKGWGRAKKEALINGDFDRLKVLAKRGGGAV